MSEDHHIAERLKFIRLDDKARAILRGLKPLIDQEAPKALDAFYAHVRQFPETRRHFNDEAHMASAKSRQAGHWGVIAAAEYGDSYVRGVRAIGMAHARLGLDPRWYIGGYAIVVDDLMHAVVRQYAKGWGGGKAEAAGDAVASLMKAVLLDMDFSISIYIEALETARKKQEAVQAEAERQQADLVRVLATALDHLASGNLAFRITDAVAGDYQKVKDDFNTAMTKLQESMRNIAQNTHGIENGTDEIAQAADDLSRRTEQQAASLEETAAALDEITATVRKTAAGAKTASDVVLLARSEAEKGGTVVTRAVSAMSSSKPTNNGAASSPSTSSGFFGSAFSSFAPTRPRNSFTLAVMRASTASTEVGSPSSRSGSRRSSTKAAPPERSQARASTCFMSVVLPMRQKPRMQRWWPPVRCAASSSSRGFRARSESGSS
jgi:methyl-accepting chemotaxis protein